ncbi:MAG: hypothetical protein AAFS10_06920 [Myxococcota bacterium]
MRLQPHRLAQMTFDTATLVHTYPARWQDANKKRVHAIACPPGSVHQGSIEVSRWKAVTLPEALPACELIPVELRADLFDYGPSGEGELAWYLNFAHAHLFVAYGGSLLAQDELQVAEHPALGSVREALVDGSSTLTPLTVEGGEPTPITLMGVERRCAIATDRNAAKGRPYGLYGNRFRTASEGVIREATRRLEPPTVTHLIAMEAPVGYTGAYTEDQLRFILTTAVTGFAAAVQATQHRFAGLTTTVHTGFWGCGAYGGNRELMALLQLLSAHMAGVDRLVFHTFDLHGLQIAQAAQKRLEQLLDSTTHLGPLIAALLKHGYRWGVGDGT